jgi:hypothetical protein
MSDSRIYMNVPAVREIAKTFDRVGLALTAVVAILDGLSTLLKNTAFIGRVGGAVLILFIDTIKPTIDEVAKKCAELSGDVNASVDAFENGDEEGATRFH